MNFVNVNYDLTKYLPDTAESAKTILSLLEEIEYLAKSKEIILVETSTL